MYPLKLEAVYKQTIWGGNKLRDKFYKKSGLESVGESWELACHESGVSKVINGELAGIGIDEVFSKYGDEVIGRKIQNLGEYPILLKLIDARGLLSIQVHPTDDYAKKHENGSLGKTEAWYILDAIEGAFLYLGFKDGVNKYDLEKALKGGGDVLEFFNKVYVKAGDVVNIEAGLLHAIGEGIVLLEIQENSDITYRVYDYDRVDANGNKREIHVEKALEVLNFELSSDIKIDKAPKIFAWGKKYEYISNKYFRLDKIVLEDECDFYNEDYSVLTCIDGGFEVVYDKGNLMINKGETVILPFVMDKCKLKTENKAEIIVINEGK